MCVIIIEGTQRLLEVELGVDYSAELEGSEEDADFIKQNTGVGKRFPGGPKCTFKGKEVPCSITLLQNIACLLASLMGHPFGKLVTLRNKMDALKWELKHDDLRITMTEREAEEDRKLNTDSTTGSPSSFLSSTAASISSISSCNTDISSLTDSFHSHRETGLITRNSLIPHPTLNLSSGMGMYVLKHIVRETDLEY